MPNTDVSENDRQAEQEAPPKGEPANGEPQKEDQGDEQTITLTPKQLRERLQRARPADYEDLKAKADRFDALEEQNKTDLQKAQDRADAAERDRDSARTEGLRWRIAAKHGVSDEDAELFLTGSDEDTLTKQAERLQARSPQQKVGLRVDHGGQTSASPSRDDAAREFFGL